MLCREEVLVFAHHNMLSLAVLLAALGLAPVAHAQTDRYDVLANSPMVENRPPPETAQLPGFCAMKGASH
jgi:hypothetical protein